MRKQIAVRLVLRLTEPEFDREIRDLTVNELRQANEVFMTASNKEVVPVVQVDDMVISGSNPGPRTRRVMELFRGYTDRFAAEG